MICADRTCDCGIVSDSLTVSGSGQQGDPYRLETNAYSIVTSVTRPASPFVGQFLWETDSERQLVWTGANWLIVGGALPGWNLTLLAADTDQVVTTGTFTTVTLPNEVSDSDGFHTGTTGVVTIPAGYGGDYLINGNLLYSGDVDGYRLVYITIGSNATTPAEVPSVAAHSYAGDATVNMYVGVSKRVRLEAGATVTLQAFHSAGNDLAVSRAFLTGSMVRHLPTLT